MGSRARRIEGIPFTPEKKAMKNKHQDHATATRIAHLVHHAAGVVGLGVLLAGCTTEKHHRHLSLDQDSIAPMLQSARAAYARAVILGFSARQTAETSVWTDYLETDLRAAIRMDAMTEHRFGSQKIAIRKARHALAILETDPVLERNLAKWQSQ